MDVTITKVGGGSVTVQSEDFFYALRHESVNGVDDIILIAGVPYVLSSATFGAGGISYGGAVIAGHPREVLYISATNTLASDSLFTRNASTGEFTIGGELNASSSTAIQISTDIVGLGVPGASLTHISDSGEYAVITVLEAASEYYALITGADALFDSLVSVHADRIRLKVEELGSLDTTELTVENTEITCRLPTGGVFMVQNAFAAYPNANGTSIQIDSNKNIYLYSESSTSRGVVIGIDGSNNAITGMYGEIVRIGDSNGTPDTLAVFDTSALSVQLGDRLGAANQTTFTIDDSVATPSQRVSVNVDGNTIYIFQGAAVADATGAGDIVAQFNTLLARLRATGGCGLIAD